MPASPATKRPEASRGRPEAARGRLGREHASLGQRVADELRRAILARRHKPGERLVEESLSAELGVSRIPIREALRVLAAEGLVEMQPRRGASVANFSIDSLMNSLSGMARGSSFAPIRPAGRTFWFSRM